MLKVENYNSLPQSAKMPTPRIHSFRGGELEFLTADSKDGHTKDTLFAKKFPISKQELKWQQFLLNHMVRPVNVEGGELQFLTADSKDAHTKDTLLAQKFPISTKI
jgi:hypothetical protein